MRVLGLRWSRGVRKFGARLRRHWFEGIPEVVGDDVPKKLDGMLDPSLDRRQLVDGKAARGPVSAVVELAKELQDVLDVLFDKVF